MSCVKSFVLLAAIVLAVATASGCGSLSPRQVCEEEVASVRAQLQQTQTLAQREQQELQDQRETLQAVKHRSGQNVQVQEQQLQAQIAEEQRAVEQQRLQLERERFRINRMRELTENNEEY